MLYYSIFFSPGKNKSKGRNVHFIMKLWERGLVTRYPAFPPKSSFNWVNGNKMQSLPASTRNTNVQIPCKTQGLFHHSLSFKKYRFLAFITVFFGVNKAWNLKHFCTRAKKNNKKAENIISSNKLQNIPLSSAWKKMKIRLTGFWNLEKTSKLLTAKFYKMGTNLIKLILKCSK